MNLSQLQPNEGARKETKRLGRGVGSGLGKTSGKGHKGQNSRSGGGVRLGFEGGQLPIYRRIPKRGFQNHGSRKEFVAVNLSSLESFEENAIITIDVLLEKGVIKYKKDGLKVLGGGSLTKKLTVKASSFSKSAKEAIEKVGGTAEVI